MPLVTEYNLIRVDEMKSPKQVDNNQVTFNNDQEASRKHRNKTPSIGNVSVKSGRINQKHEDSYENDGFEDSSNH